MSDFGVGIIVAGTVSFLGNNDRPPRSIGGIVAQVTLEERHQDDLEITEHPVERGAAITDHAFKHPAEVIIKCAWSNSLPANTGAATGVLNSSIDALGGLAVGAINNAATKALRGSIGAPLANIAGAQLAGRALSAFGLSVNSGRGTGTSRVQDIYDQLRKLQDRAEPFDIITGKRKYNDMLLRSLTVETDMASENALMVTAVCRQVLLVSTRIETVDAAPMKQAAPSNTAAPITGGTNNLVPAPNYKVSP